MDEFFFTSSLPLENEVELSPKIQSAIYKIRRSFPDQDIVIKNWNENNVAIPLFLNVNLPSRGTVDDVDIRNNEPIFLLLDRKNFPYKAPLAWSNRQDFPKDCLPHLNAKPSGSPANFCLHRGSIDTWFSEHDIIDFIQRIQEWLSDAASDRLMRKEDGFEVTRIDESIGYCIYEPSCFQEKVRSEWQSNRNRAGFCFIPYTLPKNPELEPLVGIKSSYMIKMESSLSEKIPTKIVELNREINSLYREQNPTDRFLYGLLVWPPKTKVCKKFFADLPDNLEKFIERTKDLEIPLEQALNSYLSKNLQLLAGIPVTIVIPRPRNLLKTDSTLELLNFVITFDKWTKTLTDETLESKVNMLRQRSPLTIKRAREISSTPSDLNPGKILFLGCGAIGSKLALHLMKSGQCQKITFVDDDEISPHNLIRHGLLSESLGKNKANAMKEAVESIYYADKDSLKVDVINKDAVSLFVGNTHEVLCQHSLLIDATAAIPIREALIRENLPTSLLVCRCEIADNGKLGLMSIEGAKRNPRLDDILVNVFDLAVDQSEISDWLISTKVQRQTDPDTIFEEISVGLSCNSETMRLADDSISYHAALFSLGLKKYALKKGTKYPGFLQISINDLLGKSGCCTLQFPIHPVSIIVDENAQKWQIRIKHEVQEQLIQNLRKSGRNETGGILIGKIDSKNKIIYVTRILPAPPDSKCRPYVFERGVLDIPEEVSKINHLSGEMIGYVGEWHTHPDSGKKLSPLDHEAVRKIRKVLDPVSKPTFVMIVTSQGLHPYVFSPRE